MEMANSSSISQAVKEEPPWVNSAGFCGVSEAAAISGLYANHEVKDELVVGPECFTAPDVPFVSNVSCVSIKEETQSIKEAKQDNRFGFCDIDIENGRKVKIEPGLGSDTQQAEWTVPPHLTLSSCEQAVASSTSAGSEQIWEPVQNGPLIRHNTNNIKEIILSCEICHKGFRQVCEYKAHKQTHAGEKRYSCDVCERKFSRDGNLKRHQLVHTGAKSLSCDVCQEIFLRPSTLNLHKLIHTQEKPYSCDVCKMKFKRAGHLKEHKKSHTGEKPFSCDLCEKKFARLNNLKEHKLVHNGHKQFVCDICNKEFARLGTMNRHKLIHTGSKPYACDICSKRFTLKFLMDRHKRSHAKRGRRSKTGGKRKV